MAKEVFSIKFNLEKKFEIEANDECEAREKALGALKESITGDYCIKDTDIFSITEYNEMMSNVRKVVIDYMDKHGEDLAESHIEAWSDRYRGKSRLDIDFDLNVNYDISSESNWVEESLKQDLKDEDFELNDSEIDYVEGRFIEEVLNNF